MDAQIFAELHEFEQLSALSRPRTHSSLLEIWQLSGFVNNLIVEGEPISISTTLMPDPTRYAICFIRMQAQGTVMRRCQRCLDLVSTQIQCDVNWQLMRAVLPDIQLVQGYEPLASSDYEGILALFVQEIMLYLPDIPLHPPQKCLPQGAMLVDNAALKIEPEKARNQFAALAPLSKERSSGEN